MRSRLLPPLAVRLAVLLALLALPACHDRQAGDPLPPPLAVAADARGHYCGMDLAEHPGPKGQVLLKEGGSPLWMSSVRDTLAFTMLPEEPKDWRAIYVTDLGRAADPEHPDLTAWVEVRQAWFVVGGRFRGGMGAAEPAPFAEEAAARTFAAANGGSVVRLREVPESAVLWPDAPAGEAAGGTGSGGAS